MASSPRILNRQTGTQTPKLCKKALVAAHRCSACSGVKACPWLEQGALRNTNVARRQAAKAPLAFRSLDPFRALREPDCRRRDEKRRFPLRTKKFSTTQNNRLTGKAPYKVRILLPPAVSQVRTWRPDPPLGPTRSRSQANAMDELGDTPLWRTVLRPTACGREGKGSCRRAIRNATTPMRARPEISARRRRSSPNEKSHG